MITWIITLKTIPHPNFLDWLPRKTREGSLSEMLLVASFFLFTIWFHEQVSYHQMIRSYLSPDHHMFSKSRGGVYVQNNEGVLFVRRYRDFPKVLRYQDDYLLVEIGLSRHYGYRHPRNIFLVIWWFLCGDFLQNQWDEIWQMTSLKDLYMTEVFGC